MMFLPLSFLLKCFCYGLVRLANVFSFFLLLWGILLNFIKNKKIWQFVCLPSVRKHSLLCENCNKKLAYFIKKIQYL